MRGARLGWLSAGLALSGLLLCTTPGVARADEEGPIPPPGFGIENLVPEQIPLAEVPLDMDVDNMSPPPQPDVLLPQAIYPPPVVRSPSIGPPGFGSIGPDGDSTIGPNGSRFDLP
jgi:hypothetical protein